MLDTSDVHSLGERHRLVPATMRRKGAVAPAAEHGGGGGGGGGDDDNDDGDSSLLVDVQREAARLGLPAGGVSHEAGFDDRDFRGAAAEEEDEEEDEEVGRAWMVAL